ncbi:MAG TPA: hypothetical protein VIR01_12335 [Pyrinomonadaceae bacterium]|jgi:hypothetical protein
MRTSSKTPASERWLSSPPRRISLVLAFIGTALSLGLIGVSLAAINPTTSFKCSTNEAYTIEVKDWTTTKFRDGVHVLASLKTPRGTFEFRLTTKGGVQASDPEWFLNNNPLKEVDKLKLPLDAQKCLASSARNYQQRFIERATAFMGFIETSVYASCRSAAGKHVFKVVYVADEGGGPVYVVEETVNGRFCRYAVV